MIPSFRRWMYQGHRPNWLAKIMNRITAVISSWGVAPNYMVTLEVIGRKSGQMTSLPLVMLVMGGQHYFVSMLGENVQWVKNVRAAGGKVVLRSGYRDEVQLEELPLEHEQRATILKAYLQIAPGARPHISVNKNASLSEFEKIAPAYPIFRVASHSL